MYLDEGVVLQEERVEELLNFRLYTQVGFSTNGRATADKTRPPSSVSQQLHKWW